MGREIVVAMQYSNSFTTGDTNSAIGYGAMIGPYKSKEELSKLERFKMKSLRELYPDIAVTALLKQLSGEKFSVIISDGDCVYDSNFGDASGHILKEEEDSVDVLFENGECYKLRKEWVYRL